MRRKLRLAIGSIAAAAMLASCAPAGPSSNESSAPADDATEGGDPVTLSVWSWRVEDVEQYNEIFQVFTDANPGITVDFQAFKSQEYNQVLATGLSASNGPDVAMVKSYGGVQGNIESGSLVALDGLIEGLDTFPEAYQDGIRGVEDGHVYGVPFATQTLQILYNKGIFDELGLEEPGTWDELLASAEKIKDAGYTPFAHGGADATVSVPITSDVFGVSRYGGTEFYDRVLSGETNFEDPDFVASLDVMKEIQPYLSENVVAMSYTDAQAQFIAGQAAMFPGGSWELGFFQSQGDDLEMGTFPVPPGDGWASDVALTPGFVDGGWGMGSKSEHQEEAKLLLEWMTTQEFGQLFVDKLAQMSTIPGVVFSDPLQQEMSDAFAENGAPYMMLVGFRYGQPWGTDLMGTGVQELWLGQKDAAAVAADVQEGIDTWFEPAK